MKILKEYPPKQIWDAVIGHGMKPDPKTTIFTYGDTIYVPGGLEVPDHIIVHEETHMRQQGNDPYAWWSRYIDDQFFRIQQETEAYANQYRFICKKIKDRNQRIKILIKLASDLSGPMYGNVISNSIAMQRIRNS